MKNQEQKKVKVVVQIHPELQRGKNLTYKGLTHFHTHIFTSPAKLTFIKVLLFFKMPYTPQASKSLKNLTLLLVSKKSVFLKLLTLVQNLLLKIFLNQHYPTICSSISPTRQPHDTLALQTSCLRQKK